MHFVVKSIRILKKGTGQAILAEGLTCPSFFGGSMEREVEATEVEVAPEQAPEARSE